MASENRVVRRVVVPAFLLFSALGILWALATPVFASPDENAHALKAVGLYQGEILGREAAGSRFPVFDLPEDYRYPPSIVCFAFNANMSGDCGVQLGDAGGSTYFSDWVSTYNPVYYALVGWPSLLIGGDAGVIAMRIASVLICAALLASACAAALGRAGRWMPVVVPFLMAPMAAFLIGSVNPQAVEFSAAVLLAACLLRLVPAVSGASPGPPPRLLWAGVVVGASLLALARATGPLWVVIVVGGMFSVLGWRSSLRLFARPARWLPVGIIAAVGLFSVAWTLATGTLSGQAEAGDAPQVGEGFIGGAWTMLRSTPMFIESAVGVFGWLDTPLPTTAYALLFGAAAVLLILAIVAADRRGRVVVVGACIVAVAVPVVVQAASVSRTGIIWQGRYGLFLYLIVVLLAAWVLSRSALAARLSVGGISSISVLIGLYGVIAFAVVLRRYVVGMDDPIGKMVRAPEWQPPLGWVVLLGAAVIVTALGVLWTVRLARRAADYDMRLT